MASPMEHEISESVVLDFNLHYSKKVTLGEITSLYYFFSKRKNQL